MKYFSLQPYYSGGGVISNFIFILHLSSSEQTHQTGCHIKNIGFKLSFKKKFMDATEAICLQPAINCNFS